MSEDNQDQWGIGTLMKLDVSDSEHNTWLTSYGKSPIEYDSIESRKMLSHMPRSHCQNWMPTTMEVDSTTSNSSEMACTTTGSTWTL